MKEKVIIWGCGGTGKKIFHNIKDKKKILFFIDSDPSKWNTQYEYIYIYIHQTNLTLI